MEIVEINVDNKKQVNEFIRLPFRLYKQCQQWVPPLNMDVRYQFKQSKHPFYKHGQAVFFMVKDDKEIITRVAVLNNHNYNAFCNEKTAFFYLFESAQNESATRLLFGKVFEWCKSNELNKIVGPKGFSVFDGLGLLVKGFEHRPAFGLPYNPEYYSMLLENVGFIPCREMVSGYLDETMVFPEKLHQLSELIQKRRGIQVRIFNSRKELMALMPYLKELYNSSLTGTEGNSPLTDDDVKGIANQLFWFADPKLIKIIYKDQHPIGFLLAYPDISEALQRTRGKVFPFGWIDLLLELKKTKWININGAGMIEGYRGIGGTAILFSEMYKSVSQSRYRKADIVQIGMENENMQREMRDMGIDFYKTHRFYEKYLV